MRYACEYDEKHDIAQVSQHVAVDLCEAFVNKVIPASANGEELQYGNVESPLNVYGRPSDVFEAMQMNRSFKKAVGSSSEQSSESS